MTASYIATKAKTLFQPHLIQAYISFCLRNHVPLNIVASNVECLTNELNQYTQKTPYQIEQIIIHYIPKDLQDRMQTKALFEGKTPNELIFSQTL